MKKDGLKKIAVIVSVLIQFPSALKGSWSSSRSVDSYLYSPRVTQWGNWGSWAYCHPGDYVVGVDIKIENKQGNGDDTGLNGIRLRCKSLNGQSLYYMQSKEGSWGHWWGYKECGGNGVATGFELRSEPSQGRGDDVAAADFRLLCSGPGSKSSTPSVGVLDWGYWSGEQRCPFGQAVCGLQTQVEDPLGGKADDTSLNNVDLACCKIEPPTSSCTPSYSWVRQTSCSKNSESDCTTSFTAGISYNSDRSGNVSPSTSFYEHFGLHLSSAHNWLNIRFKEFYTEIYGAGMDELINSETARNKVIETTLLDCETAIEVMVLKCGLYTITTKNYHRCSPL